MGSSSSALRRVTARCQVPPCRATRHRDQAEGCHGRAGSGARSPSGAAAAPARAWAPTARGMIDLVSASGGLSPCQAPAQTAALKGESPFPLRKAERLQRLVRGEPPAPAAPGPAATCWGSRPRGCSWPRIPTELRIRGRGGEKKGAAGGGMPRGHRVPRSSVPAGARSWQRRSRPRSSACGSGASEQRTTRGGEQGGL